MASEELIVPGYTMGEARVLIGQLSGLPAERVGGWTLVMQTCDTLDIVILSSAISAEDGYNRPEVVHMLLDAVQRMADEAEYRWPVITIEVRGIPAPQGNHRVNRSGAMYETSKAVGPWREAVRAETQRVMFTRPADHPDGRFRMPMPVAVDIAFYLPRPKSAPKRQRLPIRRPDLDKLARAVLDGLVEGGALADDSQVTCLNLTKSFASDLHAAGATITLAADIDVEA